MGDFYQAFAQPWTHVPEAARRYNDALAREGQQPDTAALGTFGPPIEVDAYEALVRDPSASLRRLADRAARALAPGLYSYLTERAPPPPPPNADLYSPGKMPIDRDPQLEGAWGDVANITSNFVGPGGAAKPLVTGGLAWLKAMAFPPGRFLPMDRAARHARAVEQGHESGFWRGERSGVLPDKYPEGAWFSRDKEYARGFAEQGGQSEPRPFWLKLDNVYKDYEPLTFGNYARIVRAARDLNPTLAEHLAESIAPGRGVNWVIRRGMLEPDRVVARGAEPAFIRQAVEFHGATPVQILKRAGFTGVANERDVRMFGGKGIRHDDAAFDLAKKRSTNIFYGLGGAGLGVVPDEQR